MPSTPLFNKPFQLRDCRTPISKRQRLSTNADTPKSLLTGAIKNDMPAGSPIVKSIKARRTEKRRSLIQASPAQATSPVVDSNTGETIKLSNEQLVNHYQNCMKLSTENKITSKNAFHLHLIDHMDDMLKERFACSSLNFMEAGGTIFASAKIYASRVDAVYSEAFRVLNGLGMHSAEKEDGEGISNGAGTDCVPQKRKKKRLATFEVNRNNICFKEMELGVEYDMLNIADIASSDGQIINNLKKVEDATALFFHAIARKMKGKQHGCSKFNEENENKDAQKNDVEETKENSRIQDECGNLFWKNTVQHKHEAVPGFDWDAITDVHKNPEIYTQENDEHSQVDPFENDLPVASPGSQNDIVDYESMGDPMSPGNDLPDCDNILNYTTGVNADTMANVTMGEYSYFKSSALSLADGPTHWKHKARKKPIIRDPNKTTDRSGKSKRKVFQMDFIGSCDCSNFKCKSSVKTKKGKEKCKEDEKLCKLASDEKFDDVMKYCSLPQLKARPFTSLLKRSHDPPTLETENYNYDNDNDANFCPTDVGDDNVTQAGFDLGATMFDATAFPDTQTDYMDMLKSDENFVAQPKKVNQVEIAYAKKAKRVDVRKLKSAMWSFIEPSNEVPQTSVVQNSQIDEPVHKPDPNQTETDQQKPDSLENDDTNIGLLHADTFTELYKHLPEKLPSKMQENLSVPLAFTCLLYLANEKKLKLDGNEDMSDIKISVDTDISQI